MILCDWLEVIRRELRVSAKYHDVVLFLQLELAIDQKIKTYPLYITNALLSPNAACLRVKGSCKRGSK